MSIANKTAKCRYCGYINFGGQELCVKCKKSLAPEVPKMRGESAEPYTVKRYYHMDDNAWLAGIRSRYGDAVYEKTKANMMEYVGNPTLAKEDFIKKARGFGK